jgi:hypothetical protein
MEVARNADWIGLTTLVVLTLQSMPQFPSLHFTE